MLVDGVCAWPKELEPLKEGASPPRPPEHWGHQSKRRLFRMLPPIPGLYLCQTHAACVCNEIVSASNRVLGVTPAPTIGGMREVRRALRDLAGRVDPVVKLTMEQTLAHFKGARFNLYNQALESFRSRPFGPADARISAFIKAEKFDPSAKVNPDPRMIQARGPRFNLLMAAYMHPLEKSVYSLKDKHGLRIFSKGLNSFQKALLIEDKFACLRHPVCYSLDASRFDKHVSLDLLREEHRFYQLMYRGDAELRVLCRLQEKNKCRVSNGTKYTVRGGRMSGDMNTAIGNCLLMYAMLQAVASSLGFEPLIVDDGDDCLMFVEAEQTPLFEREINREFLKFGMTIKLENRACRPSDVIFCQSRIIHHRMVRDWRKVLSHGTAGVKHWNDPKLVRPMMTAVGYCELACNPGIPILQEYALALIRNGRGERPKRLDVEHGVLLRAIDEVGYSGIYKSKSVPVSLAAREDFARATGVDIPLQWLIEERLSQWVVETVESVPVDAELNARWVLTVDPSRVVLPDPAL